MAETTAEPPAGVRVEATSGASGDTAEATVGAADVAEPGQPAGAAALAGDGVGIPKQQSKQEAEAAREAEPKPEREPAPEGSQDSLDGAAGSGAGESARR
ncbi:hypothetical protein AB0E27_15795 [Streptomyces sparsogenes]|uniref:hypothetical protein n=1 Tax=Streptomyces sparsogenes TaxID=67365 RepID=UPI0033FF76F9